MLKESASGVGAWTPELGFGVIDVAAAVALAPARRPRPRARGSGCPRASSKRRVALTATLSSLLTAVSSAGRAITFERQVHGTWKRVATVRTDAAGRAQTKLVKTKTPVKLRARWAGSVELAGAASKTLTLR